MSDTAQGLRVLLVSARYAPFTGGTETHVAEVARRLARSGVEVTVLTTDPAGTLPREERTEGVRVVRVRAYPARGDYYFAPGVARVVVRGGWDVVHVQGYHTFVAPTAMIAALGASAPYVVTFHSGGHTSPLRNALRGVQRRALRPLLTRARALVAVSQFEADLFGASLGLPAERFLVVPNGAAMPAQAGTGPVEAGLIVSVGRLERYKGHQRVIAAMPALLARRPDAHLRVVGVGPYEGALRALVARLGLQDRVTIAPIPPGDRAGMASLVARAELATLLSDYESQGITVLEALALGRPVLVANTSALREFVARGLARSVAPDAAPAEVAAAMLAQLERPLSPAAAALPTWDGCAARLLQLYRSLAQSGPDTDARLGRSNHSTRSTPTR